MNKIKAVYLRKTTIPYIQLSEILNLSEVTRNGIGAEGRKNVKVKFNVEKRCNST